MHDDFKSNIGLSVTYRPRRASVGETDTDPIIRQTAITATKTPPPPPHAPYFFGVKTTAYTASTTGNLILALSAAATPRHQIPVDNKNLPVSNRRNRPKRRVKLPGGTGL